MTKNKIVLLTAAVTFSGGILEAGEIVELSELSANALVEEDKAVHVTPDDETDKALNGTGSPQDDDKVDPPLTPSEDGKEPAGDDLALIRKALDDKYKRDELADAAKEVGVEFAFNARKGEIIEAVIEAGKAEAVLAL